MCGVQKQRRWFEEWRSPVEFFRAADEGLSRCFVADRVPPQFLREAYPAGLFACIWQDAREPCRVRLVPQNETFPDAQLKAEDVTLDLEVTMALRMGRRMFEEWRDMRRKFDRGEMILSETSKVRRAIAREAIPRVVRKKADKHYAVPPTLLVLSDDGRALSAEEMRQLTEPWKDRFAAIYVLSGLDAVKTWPKMAILRAKTPPGQ